MIIWGEDEKKEGWGFKIKSEHYLQSLQAAVHIGILGRNFKLLDVLQIIVSGITKNLYLVG